MKSNLSPFQREDFIDLPPEFVEELLTRLKARSIMILCCDKDLQEVDPDETINTWFHSININKEDDESFIEFFLNRDEK